MTTANEKIKLALVDDHDIVRHGLKLLLENEEQIEILFEASDGTTFFENLENSLPDVVLLDISLPDISGIEITKRLSAEYPGVFVLILSMYTDEDFVINAVKAGAKGYLPKNSKREELIEAIKTVRSGDEYFSKQISETMARSYINKVKDDKEPDPLALLTEREHEILKYVVEGFSNSEISAKLFISVRTVETHKTRILQKLGVKSTVELVKFAIKNKIINIS